MNLYSVTLPVYKKSLRSIAKILEKTVVWMEEKKITDAVLLEARLAIDMLPLRRQLQIITDNARFAAAALTGTEPIHVDDNETTLSELQARIAKTLETLDTFNEEAFEGSDARHVEIRYYPGKYITGLEYIQEYALPNFFFHLVTAYDILRHSGLVIGKGDYIGGLPLKDLEA